MRFARAAFVSFAVFTCISANAQPPEKDIADALSRVALADDEEAAALLRGLLADPAVKIEAWRKDFKEYFREGVFTTSLGLFWDAAIREFSGEDRAHSAVVSAICASEAIAAAAPRITELPAAYESLTLSFRWLDHVYPAIAPTARLTVFDALEQSLAGAGLANIAGAQPDRYTFYIQASLTLRAYAIGDATARQRLATILGLVGGPQLVWQAHGILLFDNNAYTPHHIASLNSLLGAIPKELHAIQAIIVPEATGVAPGATFVTGGQVLYLPYIPMEVFTSQQEFIEYGPMAPAFTMTCAQEIIRAVQATQFAARPELAFRRDIIMANAARVSSRYLRHYRMLSPGVYWSNADELLPALAYIYFIDSRAVFQMALGLFALKEEEPIDQFLLLADMLSGGGTTSFLYATAMDGSVTRAPASIGRVHGDWIAAPNAAGLLFYHDIIPANVWFCNAIGYGGDHYTFYLDAQGISVRYIRR